MSDIFNDFEEEIKVNEEKLEKGNIKDIKNKDNKDNKDKLRYYCGNCLEESELKMKEAVVCRHCGYRIFYKKKFGKTQYLCR